VNQAPRERTRARSALLGLEHAAVIFAADVVLARALDFVQHPTRAPAVGASLATLAMLLGGLLLGVRARQKKRRIDRTALGLVDLGPSRSTPYFAVFSAAAILAVLSGACLALPDLAAIAIGSFPVSGGLAHAMFAAGAIFLPALVLIGIGAALGTHARPGWVSGSLGGIALLFGLQIGGGWLAMRASWDPAVVSALLVIVSILSFLITGAAVALWVRRLGFGELVIIALAFGYALYLSLGALGGALLESSNIPEQQILVALSLVPSGLAIALLTVGASIGFLVFGGGRPDPSFSFELSVALRYLKLRITKTVLVIGVIVPVALILLSGNLLVMLVLSVPLALLLLIIRQGMGQRAAHFSEKQRGFVGVTLVISVMGVCLGVMALIVVLSVMSGFEDDLKTKILGAHAHVAITKKGDDFTEYGELEERIEKVDGVATAAAFVLAEGMVSSEAGLSGTLVKGIDPTDEDATAELERNVERGRLMDLLNPEQIPGARRVTFGTSTTAAATSTAGIPSLRDFAEPKLTESEGTSRALPGIVIGREMAKTLRVYVGDVINLVSPVSEEIGPTGPQPKLRRFRVAAIFYSGMYEFDSKFSYIEMKQAQRFFGMRKKVTGIELRVADLDETTRIVEEVKRRIGGYPYAVKDWREMNKELFSALLLEKLAMFIILTFIVLVASFLIVSTLVMIVLEKGREIAILKSMGASDASVMKIFVVQGLIVGFVGATLGLIGGVGICLFIQRFGIDLDPDVFYITRLPVVMSWAEIAVIVISAIMITYLASIYPAMAAAQLSPVEGLRDD
jgi:lipoprotein-releasing system permease protein